MPKKALFLHPPSGLYRRDDRCQSKVEDQTVRVIFPPLDLAYAAASAERAGALCKIIDGPSQNLSWEELTRNITSYDLIMLSVTYPTLADDLYAAELAKQYNPNSKVIARGEIFNIRDKSILEKNPFLDIVIRGESEQVIEEIIEGKSLSEILGITYRNKDEIIRNDDRPYHENLDSLPFPARHLLDNNLYRSPETGNVLTTIETGRGCPAACIFCPVHRVAGKKIRLRSPKSIVDEIKECLDKYDIKEFLFHADTFTWNKDWVLELCGLIKEKKLNIRWGCNSRVDTIDKDRLTAMKEAGCWVVGFGIETGNAETLKRIKKGASLEKALEAFRLCREVGIRSHAFFVIGFPWETRELLEENLKFARKLDPDFFDFNIAFPIPGTELYDLVTSEGLYEEKESKDGGYGKASLKTHFLSPEKLEKWRKHALWSLYLRPKYIIRTLLQAGSPGKILQYTKAAIGRMKYLLRS